MYNLFEIFEVQGQRNRLNPVKRISTKVSIRKATQWLSERKETVKIYIIIRCSPSAEACLNVNKKLLNIPKASSG